MRSKSLLLLVVGVFAISISAFAQVAVRTGSIYGKVVDMFYFPIVDTVLPEWFPLWGGQRFQFFRPVFNVSDAAITTGVITLLLFHRRIFRSRPAESVVLPAENGSAGTDISPTLSSFEGEDHK